MPTLESRAMDGLNALLAELALHAYSNGKLEYLAKLSRAILTDLRKAD